MDTIEQTFHDFFETGQRLKITPHNPRGPLRRECKVVSVKSTPDGPAPILLVVEMVTPPPKLLGEQEKHLYFSPEDKLWFLYDEETGWKSGGYMVEVVGFQYLKHTDAFETLGLSVSGDDVRRIFVNEGIRLRCAVEKETKNPFLAFFFPSEELLDEPVFDCRELNMTQEVVNGFVLRRIVYELLTAHPDIFLQKERDMMWKYLSYYEI